MAKTEKYYCDKCGKEIQNDRSNYTNTSVVVCDYVALKDLCKDCGDKLVNIVKEFLRSK